MIHLSTKPAQHTHYTSFPSLLNFIFILLFTFSASLPEDLQRGGCSLVCEQWAAQTTSWQLTHRHTLHPPNTPSVCNTHTQLRNVHAWMCVCVHRVPQRHSSGNTYLCNCVFVSVLCVCVSLCSCPHSLHSLALVHFSSSSAPLTRHTWSDSVRLDLIHSADWRFGQKGGQTWKVTARTMSVAFERTSQICSTSPCLPSGVKGTGVARRAIRTGRCALCGS